MTEMKRLEELGHLALNRQALILRAQRHSRAMRDACVERLVPFLVEAMEAKRIWLFG